MNFTLVGVVALLVAGAWLFLRKRRHEIQELREGLEQRTHARASGTHLARLQYPHIDLTRCIGCGSCVAACPEDDVLRMIHGQALVVHGARCVGHGRCAAECPVGAIEVAISGLDERRDIPVIGDNFESNRVPGLFLAGEVTGFGLIRTAIAQGTAVAAEVARRIREDQHERTSEVLDLVIVGAGPAGLACSLEAKRAGLEFATLEQSELGGAVTQYPRRKLVMTQPVELPLHGRLQQTSFSKEELSALWHDIARQHQLPIRTGEEFIGVERGVDGVLVVRTKNGALSARNVCLAVGRRGTPNRLGVPGEDLAKVAYNLLDAQSYAGRRILVVGGGDSAVEAALGLAEQPGTTVTLSYRRAQFSRLRARNAERLKNAVAARELELLLESEVLAIEPQSVTLRTPEGGRLLENDDVFVMAGGLLPFALLEASGVSFDPAERKPVAPLVEQGSGLRLALAVALLFALAVLAWAGLHARYYTLSSSEQALSPEHELLRPSGTLGLVLGSAATLLVLANLAYLARRARHFAWIPGSLQHWMTAHVATGLSAFLLVTLHAALAPGRTVGGDAYWALAILIVTGAIGRYFYSFVPRAANGRELALDEVQARLAQLSGEWDRENRVFGEEVRGEVDRLLSEQRWRGSFFHRVKLLVTNQRQLSASVTRLRARAAREGLPREQIDALAAIARQAQRAALTAAHFEDLRAILASWRYVHRWVALAMVLLVGMHIWNALRYGGIAR